MRARIDEVLVRIEQIAVLNTGKDSQISWFAVSCAVARLPHRHFSLFRKVFTVRSFPSIISVFHFDIATDLQEQRKGKIVPDMGTASDNLGSALFGKVRSSVLGLLFRHSDKEFYLREIERSVAMGHGAVQRELTHLVDVGLVKRRRHGN